MPDLTPPQAEACALLWLQDYHRRNPSSLWTVTCAARHVVTLSTDGKSYTGFGETLSKAVDEVIGKLEKEY